MLKLLGLDLERDPGRHKVTEFRLSSQALYNYNKDRLYPHAICPFIHFKVLLKKGIN